MIETTMAKKQKICILKKKLSQFLDWLLILLVLRAVYIQYPCNVTKSSYNIWHFQINRLILKSKGKEIWAYLSGKIN